MLLAAPKQPRGFTLIELVVIIILLAILSAIALPRYIDLTNDAQKTMVITTASAFDTAVKVMNGKWALGGKPVGAGLTLPEIPTQYGKIVFTKAGFPAGFTKRTFNATTGGSTFDITQVTYTAANASSLITFCQDLIQALLSDTSIVVAPWTTFSNGQYTCAASSQLCANIVYNNGSKAVTGCGYGYNGGTASFTYYPSTGAVVIDDPTVTH